MSVISTDRLKHEEHTAQLCVVGGGLAGLIAAISAARHGTKVILMQDRPVLGGNASSEIRMWVRGAHGLENKETGILSELELENIYRNPDCNPFLWDSVLYQKALEEKNLTLLLNCSCVDAEVSGNRIASVTGWQLTTYTWHTVRAEIFADCSGDSILAPLTGAEYRHGREAGADYAESIEPEQADRKTMGMSCLLQARETDHKVTYIAPPFAYTYENDSDFANIRYNEYYDTSRDHIPATDGCNFWWMELGGEDHSIYDTERLRDELLKIAFGIWDHVKNHGDHGADNWELEWVGFLPGKRESRRYVGDYMLTQGDIQTGGNFTDTVAFGGWPLDDHDPAGMHSLRKDSKTGSQMLPVVSPYGIPYRCLYSRNIENLMFAGRNISATHAANSSSRVMGTCSVVGQAMGTAAALAVRFGLSPREVGKQKITLLQQLLMDDYCLLPHFRREMPALTREAATNLTDAEKAALFDGLERPYPQTPSIRLNKGNIGDNMVNVDGPDELLYQTPEKHYVVKKSGEAVTFRFEKPRRAETLRIVFDLDFTRLSVSDNRKERVFAMKCNEGLDFRPMRMPAHLCREFSVEVTDAQGNRETIYHTENNRRDLFTLPLGREIRELTVRFGDAWAGTENRIFACDLA